MSAVDAKAINIHMQVTGPYAQQMARNGAVTQRFGNQAHAGMAKASSGMARFGAVASKIGMVSAIAIAGGLLLSAKAAIDFETSFTGVRKTVDASEAGFRRLADGVRAMALEIPIGVNELNRIMELGGQLGVDEGNLLGFTDTIAKIGVTTTLATEEAAMGFARLDNIMQLGGKSFDNMGATIVDLGNNFASTENEILTFALRIAPVGATVGLATDEILAIATAFSSVGVPAERGGTAIQKTFIKIADAAESGGKELSVFADTAGMTADEFAKLFKQDPAAAFTAFIQGLNRIEEEGGNVFTVLDAVHLGNQRVISSLLAMANAEGVLTDALGLSEEAWEDNIALTEEAEKRFETTASKLTLVKNQLVDIGIAIGGELLPYIGDLAKGFSTIIDWVDALDPAIKSITLAIGAMSAAMWLAVNHPIILGLAAVAAGIMWIGRQAANAEARVNLLKDALESDTLTRPDFESLLGADFTDELFRMGFTAEELAEGLFGTDADFQKVADKMEANYRSLMPPDLSTAGVGKINEVEQYRGLREELIGIESEQSKIIAAQNRMKILGMSDLVPGFEPMDRTFIQSLMHYRQGLDSLEPVEIVPAYIDDDTMDDVVDAVDGFNENLADSFAETDDEIRGFLDMWYEFPDEFEAAFQEALDSMSRQVSALRSFNTLLSGLNLDRDVEDLIRQLNPSAAHMEAFLALDDASRMSYIAQARTLARQIQAAIMEEYSREAGQVEFVSGEQFVADLSGIAQDMFNDDKNTNTLTEIWLGLIEASVNAAEPGMKEKILGALGRALEDDGTLRGKIDILGSEFQFLIDLLNELEGDYTVNVHTHFTQTGQPFDPMYGAPIETVDLNTGGGYQGGRTALGGNVAARVPQLVGELGPELFVPFNSGTIIPNNKLKSGGDRTTIVNVYRPETNDLAGDISEGLTRASITEQVDMIGAY
ncbi:phage tail tape measure protein [bacterium]|nr:MAG: phage tail tape measure protein [bacterium]